jgi:hypothetical protein
MVPEQVQHEYSVTDEFQEVSSSADPLLLQLIVYLVDVQDCQHEYPVREEVREVSYSADPLLPTANSIPDGQPGWPAWVSSEEWGPGGLFFSLYQEILQATVYQMDSQDGQHEYPVREEAREVSSSADILLLQPTVYLMDN